MSRKSEKIRASRRDKQARRWAGNEKAHHGARRDGLVKQSKTGLECNRPSGASNT